MAATRRKEMTADEFLIWCLDQDDKYELVDGFPVPLRAMAGASRAHDRIVTNLIARLHAKLDGGPCMPATSDTALRTAIKRVRRPDVMIECTPVQAKSYEAMKPAAVFEVLSPTTRKTDRLVKLAEYMRHPTLMTIVHIDPDMMDVLVYRRDGDQWIDQWLSLADDRVTLTNPDIGLSLAEIYAGVPLAPTVANEA
jgi:Uma2 family endonuclease